jgi:glycerol uptake facilitator protein
MKYGAEFLGELLGTFLLVFFGCGTLAATVLFSAHTGLFQVAILWGIGVALSIYATRHLSCAHLNPAVSIAMAIGGRMSPARLPTYLTAQFLGAFMAAAVIYLLFADSIARFENMEGIVRGTASSVRTAMIFGEFYPNPGAGPYVAVTMPTAFMAESGGTFLLVMLIMSLTEGCNLGRPDDSLAPMFIGLTVTILISILGPLTQAGFNPARDLAPRLFAMLMGWKSSALTTDLHGWLTVYVLGPIGGGILAALTFTRLIEPALRSKKPGGDCSC